MNITAAIQKGISGGDHLVLQNVQINGQSYQIHIVQKDENGQVIAPQVLELDPGKIAEYAARVFETYLPQRSPVVRYESKTNECFQDDTLEGNEKVKTNMKAIYDRFVAQKAGPLATLARLPDQSAAAPVAVAAPVAAAPDAHAAAPAPTPAAARATSASAAASASSSSASAAAPAATRHPLLRSAVDERKDQDDDVVAPARQPAVVDLKQYMQSVAARAIKPAKEELEEASQHFIAQSKYATLKGLKYSELGQDPKFLKLVANPQDKEADEMRGLVEWLYKFATLHYRQHPVPNSSTAENNAAWLVLQHSISIHQSYDKLSQYLQTIPVN